MIKFASTVPAEKWLTLESRDGVSKLFTYGKDARILVTQQNIISPECKALSNQNGVNLDSYETKLEFVVQYTTSQGTTVQTILANSISLISSMIISEMLISGFVALFEQVVGRGIEAITESGLMSVENAMATRMAYMRCMSWAYSPSWLAGGLRFLAKMSVYALIGYLVLTTIVPFLIRQYKYQLLITNFSKSLLRIKVPYISNVDNANKYKDINDVLQPVALTDTIITINGFDYKIKKNMVSQGLLYFYNNNTFLEGMSDLVTITVTDEKNNDSKSSICIMTDIPRFADNRINAVSSQGMTDFEIIYKNSITKHSGSTFNASIEGKKVEFNMLPSLSGAENNAYDSVCNIYDS